MHGETASSSSSGIPHRGPGRQVRDVLEILRQEALLADAQGDSASARALRAASVALAARHGAETARPVPVAPAGATVRMTCFSRFTLSVDGSLKPLDGLRPRARTTMRLLASNAGRPVHREVLLDALWADAEPGSAARSMLTTVSSLRAVLSGTPADGALLRDGEAYLLDPDLVTTDVAEVECALRRARELRPADVAAADDAYEHALGLYQGDLLSEDGPAEWVVDQREQWRSEMAGAAHELAELRQSAGNPDGAVRAARRGLAVDRLHDPLWRVLVAALRSGDDVVAAERATAEYQAVVLSLSRP